MKALFLLAIIGITLAQLQGNSTGCGSFLRGCPASASCVQTNQFSRTCVCNEQGAYIDLLSYSCVTPCPPFSVRENGTCKCVAPYVASSSGNFSCVISQQATCQNVNCSLGYRCAYNHSVPTCIRDQNYAVCGNDFRCPDKYVCVDSTTGPYCKCVDGYSGPLCQYRRCTISGNALGCPNSPNGTVCVATTSSDAFCLCEIGRSPPDCATSELCSRINCSIANSECVSGRCVCQDGYVAVLSNRTISCQPAFNCSSIQCTGNTQCVTRNNVPQCVCPADRFGASDCSRPSCSSDIDCTNSGFVNSYCVNKTRSGIAGFCVCKPGWTGDKCDQQTQRCNCSSNTVCNNEHRCVCSPYHQGENCTRPATPQCITIIVHARYNASRTTDSLKAFLAHFIGVDQSTINITSEVNVNSTFVIYTIRICRDNNTDEQSASDDFVNNVNSGQAEQAGLTRASISSDTTSGTESSSSQQENSASSLSTFAAFVLALFVMIFL